MRAAWLGAWEGGLHKVAETLGFESMRDLMNAWPELVQTIDRVEAQQAQITGKQPLAYKWPRRIQQPEFKKQREMLKDVNENLVRMMYEQASTEDAVRIEGAGTKDAAAWMNPPEGEEPMPDKHFRIAMGMRLNVLTPLAGSAMFCQNYSIEERSKLRGQMWGRQRAARPDMPIWKSQHRQA